MATNDQSFARLQSELEELREEVQDLTKSTRALVEAWNTATGVVKFVKVLSSLVAAIAAIYFFATHGFTQKVP